MNKQPRERITVVRASLFPVALRPSVFSTAFSVRTLGARRARGLERSATGADARRQPFELGHASLEAVPSNELCDSA
jgi:hypothetical protein